MKRLLDLVVLVVMIAGLFLFIGCTVVLLQSCTTAAQPIPSPSPTHTEIIHNDQALPASPLYVYVPEKGATETERKKLQIAAGHLNRVLQSDCFDSYVSDPKSRIDWKQAEGHDAASLIRYLRLSAPTVSVAFYRKNNLVHGHRVPKEGARVHLNRKYFDKYHTCTWASTMLHETAHVLGFGHDFKRTSRRAYSVPYRMNAMMERCCK